MILPPRTLAIRLVFWTALLVYAIWNLRGRSADEVFAEAPPPPPVVQVPLPAPADAPAPLPGEAPVIVDIEAAVAAMDAAAAGVATCGVTGTFGVRLGAAGLAEAWIVPAHPDAPPAPPGPPPGPRRPRGSRWSGRSAGRARAPYNSPTSGANNSPVSSHVASFTT